MSRAAHGLFRFGVVAFVLLAAKFHAAVFAAEPYDLTQSGRFAWTFAYIGVLLVAGYAFGLPDVPKGRAAAATAGLGTAIVAGLSISAAQLAFGTALLPRFVVFAGAVATVPWSVVCAGFGRDARTWDAGRDRVLVVGDWVAATELEHELDTSAERPARIVLILPVEQASATSDGRRPLLAAAEDCDANVVVLDRAAQIDDSIIEQVATLHERGVRIRTLSLFYEEWLGKLPVTELERVSLMFDIGELHRQRYSRSKRTFDLAVGLIGLAVLAAVIPIVFAGNLLGNRGPLFFRQRRVGRGGKEFTMLKFRSMRSAPTSSTTDWTAPDDSRVTRFGGLMRRTHIDELPQLLNIVTGHLSVVGPRPEQPRYVAELTEKLPFYQLRHLVRPGLTGWAQVKYGYAGDDRDALEKLQYEFYYLRRQSFSFDMRVITRTLRSVILGDGR